MGKHDKTESTFAWTDPTVEKISYEPPTDEWYRSRIAELKAENARLRDELHEMQRSVGNYELAIDHQDEVHNGCIAEYEQLIEEKDGEIDTLKVQIKMLKEAVVKGALREVLA